MTLLKELVDQTAQTQSQRAETEEFVRLRAFYEEMKRLGLVRKQTYDLPLMDTIGHSIFSTSADHKTRP